MGRARAVCLRLVKRTEVIIVTAVSARCEKDELAVCMPHWTRVDTQLHWSSVERAPCVGFNNTAVFLATVFTARRNARIASAVL